MEDIREVLNDYMPKKQMGDSASEKQPKKIEATTSEIPDLFFDDILVKFKLTRMDIVVLMYLYRVVWCRPNLHKDFGISPIVSYADLTKKLDLTLEEISASIRKLETFEFLETIRAGQFFVRKYFTKENDLLYGQHYDDFI